MKRKNPGSKSSDKQSKRKAAKTEPERLQEDVQGSKQLQLTSDDVKKLKSLDGRRLKAKVDQLNSENERLKMEQKCMNKLLKKFALDAAVADNEVDRVENYDNNNTTAKTKRKKSNKTKKVSDAKKELVLPSTGQVGTIITVPKDVALSAFLCKSDMDRIAALDDLKKTIKMHVHILQGNQEPEVATETKEEKQKTHRLICAEDLWCVFGWTSPTNMYEYLKRTFATLATSSTAMINNNAQGSLSSSAAKGDNSNQGTQDHDGDRKVGAVQMEDDHHDEFKTTTMDDFFLRTKERQRKWNWLTPKGVSKMVSHKVGVNEGALTWVAEQLQCDALAPSG